MMGWTCPGYGMGGGWGYLGMLPGFIIFAGILIAIVLGTMWLVKQRRQPNIRMSTHKNSNDPLLIAKRRLASGEITSAEFEEIRDRIQE